MKKIKVHIYEMDEKYSVECFQSKNLIDFYLTNGIQTMFCISVKIKENEDEKEIAESIFNDYIVSFQEIENLLACHYEEKFTK